MKLIHYNLFQCTDLFHLFVNDSLQMNHLFLLQFQTCCRHPALSLHKVHHFSASTPYHTLLNLSIHDARLNSYDSLWFLPPTHSHSLFYLFVSPSFNLIVEMQQGYSEQDWVNLKKKLYHFHLYSDKELLIKHNKIMRIAPRNRHLSVILCIFVF